MKSTKDISLLQSESANSSSPFEIKPLHKTTMISLFFYTVLFISKLISSAETAIIISSRFKIDRHLSFKTLGYLGLFTAIGRGFGSIAYSFMFKKDYVRLTLIITMALKALSFAFIFLEFNYSIILISRILFGMIQIFELLFYPNWVDDFFEKRIWFTFFINVSTPLGLILGYQTSFNVQAYSWKKYFILFFLVSACSCIILIFSSFKFLRRYNYRKKSDEILQEAGATINKKEFIIIYKLIEPIYLLSVSGRTILMLIFSISQFWLNDYMVNVLIISDFKTIFGTFTLLCFICPILGNLLENYLSKAVIESEKHLIIIMIISSSVISIMSLCLSWVNGIKVFLIFIWIYFIISSGLISILSSLSQNTNSAKQSNLEKETFAHIFINICGSGFGIFLYGMLREKYNSKFPMLLLINSSWLAWICVCCITYLKWNTPEINYLIKTDQPEQQTNPLRLTRTSDIIRGRYNEDNNFQDTISIADDDNLSKNDEDLFSVSFHLQNQSFSSNKVIDFNK